MGGFNRDVKLREPWRHLWPSPGRALRWGRVKGSASAASASSGGDCDVLVWEVELLKVEFPDRTAGRHGITTAAHAKSVYAAVPEGWTLADDEIVVLGRAGRRWAILQRYDVCPAPASSSGGA